MAGELSEVRERYAGEALRYERRWASYLEGTLRPTLEALGGAGSGRLLDVGSGTGLLLERVRLQGSFSDLHGVDVSPAMTALATRRLAGRASLIVGDAHELPYASAAFDAVVSTSALHHWARPAVALGEMARVLRLGGRLVLTDWSDDYLQLRVFSRLLRLKDRSHHGSYSSRRLRALLTKAGLRVERIQRYRVGWLWGMMTAVAQR